jgi:hypothetical protein
MQVGRWIGEHLGNKIGFHVFGLVDLGSVDVE